jgi:hypothetical protein
MPTQILIKEQRQHRGEKIVFSTNSAETEGVCKIDKSGHTLPKN